MLSYMSMSAPSIQIIRDAQSPNPVRYKPAIQYLINIHEPLLSFYIRNFSNNNNFEDLRSSGYTGILEGISSYEPGHKTSLKTWIYVHIRRRVGEERTREHTVQLSRYNLKRGVKITHEEYKEEFDTLYDEPPINTLISDEDRELLMDRITLNNLKWTAKEVNIFTDFLVFASSFREMDKKYRCNSRYIISKLIKRLKATPDLN